VTTPVHQHRQGTPHHRPTAAAETVTVDIGALVDGQVVTNFPSVTLVTTDIYQFGPFHSVLDNTGTNGHPGDPVHDHRDLRGAASRASGFLGPACFTRPPAKWRGPFSCPEKTSCRVTVGTPTTRLAFLNNTLGLSKAALEGGRVLSYPAQNVIMGPAMSMGAIGHHRAAYTAWASPPSNAWTVSARRGTAPSVLLEIEHTMTDISAGSSSTRSGPGCPKRVIQVTCALEEARCRTCSSHEPVADDLAGAPGTRSGPVYHAGVRRSRPTPR